MTQQITEMAIESLDDILEQERKALLEGDFETLERLLETKEALVSELRMNPGEENAEILSELEAKLRRNQGMLDHALEGIRNVSRRMAMLRRVRSSLDTYDQSGRKNRIEMDQESTVEKRA